MNKTKYPSLFAYIIAITFLIAATVGTSHTMTVLSENASIDYGNCIIIDAGHGGVDGGATSCSGILESKINLDISLRLQDLFHLLGYQTYMIRTDDRSIHTQGESIAAKKVSDLKERVRIVNESNENLLISIHQNYYQQSKYAGAQVFYAPTDRSDILAKNLQDNLVKALNPGSHRRAKAGKGIYLLEHIKRPGVLIECGFLSNPEEERNLLTDAYQKKLCATIACTVSQFLTQGN